MRIEHYRKLTARYKEWDKILDMKKITEKIGKNRKFAYSFTTDGVSICLLVEKEQRRTCERQRIINNYSENQYDYAIGKIIN